MISGEGNRHINSYRWITFGFWLDFDKNCLDRKMPIILSVVLYSPQFIVCYSFIVFFFNKDCKMHTRYFTVYISLYTHPLER